MKPEDNLGEIHMDVLFLLNGLKAVYDLLSKNFKRLQECLTWVQTAAAGGNGGSRWRLSCASGV